MGSKECSFCRKKSQPMRQYYSRKDTGKTVRGRGWEGVRGFGVKLGNVKVKHESQWHHQWKNVSQLIYLQTMKVHLSTMHKLVRTVEGHSIDRRNSCRYDQNYNSHAQKLTFDSAHGNFLFSSANNTFGRVQACLIN